MKIYCDTNGGSGGRRKLKTRTTTAMHHVRYFPEPQLTVLYVVESRLYFIILYINPRDFYKRYGNNMMRIGERERECVFLLYIDHFIHSFTSSSPPSSFINQKSINKNTTIVKYAPRASLLQWGENKGWGLATASRRKAKESKQPCKFWWCRSGSPHCSCV